MSMCPPTTTPITDSIEEGHANKKREAAITYSTVFDVAGKGHANKKKEAAKIIRKAEKGEKPRNA